MLGEDHGRCIELGTALKNLSEYGKRHDGKVIYGTGETFPATSEGSKVEIYKGNRSEDKAEGSRRGT
jgi:hypothetical protein